MIDLLRRYGKYLGGIDYLRIMSMLDNEELELRKREEWILGFTTGPQTDILRSVERRQLVAKYEQLRQKETHLLGLLNEVRRRGLCMDAVIHRLGRLRRIMGSLPDDLEEP